MTRGRAAAPSGGAAIDSAHGGSAITPWSAVRDRALVRQAPDPDPAREAVVAALDAVEAAHGTAGLARFDGRMVVELRPAGAGGKGAAVERLLDAVRPRAAIALGDDRTDAEAFAVLTSARAAGRLDALVVGVDGGHEVPTEVVAAADVLVASPRAAARVLAALARATAASAALARATAASRAGRECRPGATSG